MDNKFRQLIELGAGEFEHADNVLISHLESTRCLLKEWNAELNLQEAALYHVAYSSEVFSLPLFDDEQREQVNNIIGHEVENIIYHYCACDKERLYEQLGQQIIIFHDRFRGEQRIISDTLLKQICELTAAIEIDKTLQNSNVSLQQKINLCDLFTQMKPQLSPRAQRKVLQVFCA